MINCDYQGQIDQSLVLETQKVIILSSFLSEKKIIDFVSNRTHIYLDPQTRETVRDREKKSLQTGRNVNKCLLHSQTDEERKEKRTYDEQSKIALQITYFYC